MRRIVAVGLTVVITIGSALLGSKQSTETPTGARNERHWVKVTFGLEGAVADWDGAVSIRNGKRLNIESWGFEPTHQFDAAAGTWACSTLVNDRRTESTFAEPYRGFVIEVESNPQTEVVVRTRQGHFEFRPAELVAGRPLYLLAGRASAERLGTAQPMLGPAGVHPRFPESRTYDDFPTQTVDGAGHRWLAWIGYDHEQSRDVLQVVDLDNPSATVTAIDAGRFQASPVLLTDEQGFPWLAWSGPHDRNWDIYVAGYTATGWTAPQRITSAEGNDFHLTGASGSDGRLWLAWQSLRNGNSDVFVKFREGGAWSADIAVTGDSANQWEPSISVDKDGRAWVAYDSYEHGNYDVYLKSISIERGGRAEVSDPIAIACSQDFEAHAQVEATGEKVWVAYDAAGPNWGKDVVGSKTTYRGVYAEPIHTNRRIELRGYADGAVWKMEAKFPQRLDTLRPSDVSHVTMGEVRRFYEMPQLARDHAGRLWAFFRLNRQGYADAPQPALWEIYATPLVGDEWQEPILLPQSWGRQNQRVAVVAVGRQPNVERSPGATAVRPVPGLYCAWSRGRHHELDTAQQIRVGRVPAVEGPVAEPKTVPCELPQITAAFDQPIENWKVQLVGATYQVYFGDLHRHTDISWCYPTLDGSPVDAMRYALDAAQLDFLAITDHTRDTDPFPWWHTQKVNDWFYIDNKFSSIYGYERSNQTPGGGHRNVFFVERDWPVMRSEHYYRGKPGLSPGRLDPPAALYPKIRGKAALTAAHTPNYSKAEMLGTWSYNDSEVEPLVEIYQGFRRSYERPDQGVLEEASVWYALNKGYRLGFIASSDHVSTHVSYACVWATGVTREELFEAMRARRTYAATDKILLDVRIGDAFMGEETRAIGKPQLKIHALGTDQIDEIQIIKNAQVLARLAPNETEVHTTFTDDEYSGEPAWYYVRLHQTNGAMAWGSPIWVK